MTVPNDSSAAPERQPARRFDHCTKDCTADCGDCKGRPVEAMRDALNQQRAELINEKRERSLSERHLTGLLGRMRPLVEMAGMWRDEEPADLSPLTRDAMLMQAVDDYRAATAEVESLRHALAAANAAGLQLVDELRTELDRNKTAPRRRLMTPVPNDSSAAPEHAPYYPSATDCGCQAWDPIHNPHTETQHTDCGGGLTPDACGGCDSCMSAQVAYWTARREADS